MLRTTAITLCLFLLVGAVTAFAGEKTVVFTVEGITCASTDMQAKYAIQEIKGVSTVETSMDDQTATITFDDEVTSIEEIKKAMAAADFPSSGEKILE